VSELFWSALALMLVFEGVLPFVNPGLWREVFSKAAQMPDNQVRWMGAISMGLGVVLLMAFLT
jgi:uncharacterized protein YjeT (DUF2065 family)